MSDTLNTEEQARPKKKPNLTYIVGIIIILGFAISVIPSLKKSMTPYVEKISEVKNAHAGETIQVRGEIDNSDIKYDKSGAMLFTIQDASGDKLNVRYPGTKPGNLEQAPWIVVVGVYEDGVFQADNLIVKCPDKYQAEDKPTK